MLRRLRRGGEPHSRVGALLRAAQEAFGPVVTVAPFDTWDEAALAHHEGVMRLLRLHLADKLKYLRGRHGLPRSALLAWSSIGSVEELAADLVERCLADTAGDLAQIREAGGLAHAYPTDLSSYEEVDALAETVLREHGGVTDPVVRDQAARLHIDHLTAFIAGILWLLARPRRDSQGRTFQPAGLEANPVITHWQPGLHTGG